MNKNIKSRRIRVDFQKIVNGLIDEDTLHIYQWLIKLGRRCNKQYGWNRYGLHQSFHGYSYNNEPYEKLNLGEHWQGILHKGFVNILCKTNQVKVVKEFLEKENIKLGKMRYITISESGKSKNYYSSKTNRDDFYYLIYHITTAYKGLELRKEFFHPDFEKRLKPRILSNVKFGTSGSKWYVWFDFSFECIDYESGWNYTISQNENESLRSFLDRAIEELDNLLVEADSCDNCPYWVQHNRGDYLRHGIQGVCKMYNKCNKTNVVKYKWWSEEGKGVMDNAIHESIVFPYYKKRNRT